MRKHYFSRDWRKEEWDTSLGERLRKLNKKWVIKKHYRDEYNEFS